MHCGIYKFENNINHKVYIGQAIDLYERKEKHKKNMKDLSHQEYFYKALRKYGWDNFSYEILEEFDIFNQEQLNNLENYYIQLFNSLIPNGYNMIPGGTNGAGLAKGKIVEQYDLQGNFLKEYSSAHEAARQTNINYSSICACCRDEITHVKEYQWKYKNSDKIIKTLTKQDVILAETAIWQFDLKGNFIQEYSSLKEAAEKTGTYKAPISKACNHKGWTSNNYFWCFKNDIQRLNEYLKKKKIIKGDK